MAPKRSADASQAPRKKQHVESKSSKPPSSSKSKSTGKKTRFDEAPAPRRKAPITSTAPLKDDSATDEEEDMSDDGPLDEEEDGDAPMDIDGGHSAPRQPKAAGENHAEQRRLAKERRLARPNGQLLVDAKVHWELARQINLTKETRQKHVSDLMAVVKGKVKELVTKHDASRVIQTLVKYGTQAQRDQVARELTGSYRDMSLNRYSKYLVLKLLRHCTPALRSSILSEFHGHVLRLLLHREATVVISDAFELYAGNAGERNLLIRDFYGNEVALFDSEKVKAGGLGGVLEGVDEARRERLLNALRNNLLRLFNNPDKGAVGHSIVHRALWEYLQESSKLPNEEDQRKRRNEMFESCTELLAELAHTRDGSRAVREFVAWGSASDRKKILKTFKPHLEKTCMDDQAQLVLFTCLDAIDDTRTAVSDLVKHIVALAPKLCFPSPSSAPSDTNGTATSRRTLLYLLVPRDQRYFPPALSRTIAETDGIIAKTSKKDVEVKRKELRAGASPKLLEFVREEAGKLLRDPAASLLAADVMLHTDGDKSIAMAALLKPLIDTPYPSEEHIIDLPHASRLYKTLLQGGHFSMKTKSITPVASYSPINFARALYNGVGKDNLLAMATSGGGPGTFVLVELLERFRCDGTDEEREELKTWLAEARKQIEGSDVKGKEALIAKVEEL